MDWKADAACRGMDSEIFVADNGVNDDYAKQICAACRVSAKCLEYAVALREQWGIWGGLTGRERKRRLPSGRVTVIVH